MHRDMTPKEKRYVADLLKKSILYAVFASIFIWAMAVFSAICCLGVMRSAPDFRTRHYIIGAAVVAFFFLLAIVTTFGAFPQRKISLNSSVMALNGVYNLIEVPVFKAGMVRVHLIGGKPLHVPDTWVTGPLVGRDIAAEVVSVGSSWLLKHHVIKAELVALALDDMRIEHLS